MSVIRILILLCLLPVGLAAATHTHEETGLQITFPDSYTVRQPDSATLIGIRADTNMSVVIKTLPQVTLSNMASTLKDTIKIQFKDFRTADEGWDTLAGMRVYIFRYYGIHTKTTLALEGLAILVEAPKALAFILTSSQADTAITHRDDLRVILGSIKKQ